MTLYIQRKTQSTSHARWFESTAVSRSSPAPSHPNVQTNDVTPFAPPPVASRPKTTAREQKPVPERCVPEARRLPIRVPPPPPPKMPAVFKMASAPPTPAVCVKVCIERTERNKPLLLSAYHDRLAPKKKTSTEPTAAELVGLCAHSSTQVKTGAAPQSWTRRTIQNPV